VEENIRTLVLGGNGILMRDGDEPDRMEGRLRKVPLDTRSSSLPPVMRGAKNPDREPREEM